MFGKTIGGLQSEWGFMDTQLSTPFKQRNKNLNYIVSIEQQGDHRHNQEDALAASAGQGEGHKITIGRRRWFHSPGCNQQRGFIIGLSGDCHTLGGK